MDSIRRIIDLVESASSLKKESLPYSNEDLSPVISKETMDLHYDVLYLNYIKTAKKEPSNKFAYAGAVLHSLYFKQFKNAQKTAKPSGKLALDINAKYGSFSKFKTEVIDACMDVHGSGWIYVSKTLAIKEIPNHEERDDILLIIDCWEHAYILDYSSDKKAYYKNIWEIINWEYIEGMYS